MSPSDSPPSLGNPQWQHRDVDVGEVRLHVVEAGPIDGPLVVLLHGFPEFWFSWRHQIPALAAAGFRVVAPDLRGYGGSDKPRGVAAYRIEHLVADVAGLIAACGRERAHVIGHDWGAALAWMVANDRPDVVARLAILNVPHPRRMIEGIRHSAEQRRKSWYIAFFQIPWLPERFIASQDFRRVRSMLRRDPVRPGAFTPDEIQAYVDALKQPGALTAAINWYRAAVRRARRTGRRFRPIEAPVLVLWGDRDRYLSAAYAAPPPDLVPHARVVHYDASHWLPCDAPDAVNEELLGFLRADPGGGETGGSGGSRVDPPEPATTPGSVGPRRSRGSRTR
jgi:pimeloyl-ACP methyl ester carboxylesterase